VLCHRQRNINIAKPRAFNNIMVNPMIISLKGIGHLVPKFCYDFVGFHGVIDDMEYFCR
jgi:hypothetical protein